MRKRVAALLLATATLCSCMEEVRHLSFVPINLNGWAMEDTLLYTVDTLEKSGEDGIELLFHTEGYSYTNLAIHIRIVQDSSVLYDELVNAELQQSAPTKGIGKRCDYTLPVTNLTLSDSTHTTIRLTHQMSDSLLRGVREIGIRIGPPVRHPGEVVWQVEW